MSPISKLACARGPGTVAVYEHSSRESLLQVGVDCCNFCHQWTRVLQTGFAVFAVSLVPDPLVGAATSRFFAASGPSGEGGIRTHEAV
jgi:hypothetical protein